MQKITLLSGGSDGEDGPTDAAGAWADAGLLKAARKQGLQPRAYLEPHNAYVFFDRLEGLIRTGPTHTNVMDLRVGIVAG
jgi:glycerate-2-kinase